MSNEVSSRSERLAVASLSDAMGQHGLKFQTLDARIRPVFTPIAVLGPAYTVQCYAGATFAVEEAIEKAEAGSVLVIAGEGYTGAVLMGELLSARAHHRGVAGAVIDGAVRDTAKLREAQWPIFAAAITPRAGTHDKLGEQQIPISCGGVVVRPGDIIAGDDDGIVVVPHERWAEVQAWAQEIERKEAFLAKALAAGASLGEAVARYKAEASGEQTA